MTTSPVDVMVHVDPTPYLDQVRKATEILRLLDTTLTAQADSGHTIRKLNDTIEVLNAGTTGRWYVRGAMDQRYAKPAARDRAVKTLAARGNHHAAAALLRGWVEHRDTKDPNVRWVMVVGPGAVGAR